MNKVVAALAVERTRPAASGAMPNVCDPAPEVVPLPVPVASDEGSLVRQSGYTLLGRLAMAASRGLGLVLVSRELGAAQFGEYSLVVTSYAIASGLGTLGLDQAHVHVTGARRQSTRTMLGNAFWTTQILGSAASALFVAVVGLLHGRIFDGTPETAILLTAAVLPGVLLHNACSGIVIGRAWFRYCGIVESAKWLLHLAFIAGLAATSRLTIQTALAALYVPIVLSGLVHAIALLYAERLSLASVILRRPDFRGLREVTTFGTKACAINVSHVLHMRLDVYLIKYFSSSAIVGRYALAVNITDVLLYLGRSVGLVLFAQRSATPAGSPRAVPRIARLVVATVGVVAVLMFTFGSSLVGTLFGPQYAGCMAAVLCRLPGLLAESGSFVLVGDLLGRARMRVLLRVNLAAIAVGGLLNVMFVPLGGIVVAAGAFSAASWLRLVLLTRTHARTTGLPALAYLRPGSSDLALLRGRKEATK